MLKTRKYNQQDWEAHSPVLQSYWLLYLWIWPKWIEMIFSFIFSVRYNLEYFEVFISVYQIGICTVFYGVGLCMGSSCRLDTWTQNESVTSQLFTLVSFRGKKWVEIIFKCLASFFLTCLSYEYLYFG